MPSDFSAVGKVAVDSLPVPPMSFDAIRMRADTRRGGERLRRFILVGALVLGTVGTAVAGANYYQGVRLWFQGGKAAVVVQSFEMLRDPRAAEVRAAVANASFPIIFPVGVPAGSSITHVFVAPVGHPTSIAIDYHNANGFGAGIMLFDASAANATTLPGGGARPRFGRVYQWRVGSEIVVIPKSAITDAQVDRIKAAMAQSNPAASLAATETMLPTLIVLGGSSRLGVAEQIGADRNSVLLDEQWVRSIPRRLKQSEPIRDARITSISNVPYANGEPQYNRATGLSWSKNVVITLAGMRAISNVLASRKAPCNCYVLYDGSGAQTYRVWVIPPTGKVEGYEVDAGGGSVGRTSSKHLP